ncbi:anthranilate synthase component 1 [Actinomyces sp. B33]|uniref:anthranilate synthase component 1 n=1 Tax=Actinomyces sp. B33 TaxID=2942131 RepID=UPI002341FEFB|nr:anthranilate synthase component 1 [Actinomyces sp. B33]MDC4233987.1 anthranilate synthase component 1 [Actinomyces sp. B33]
MTLLTATRQIAYTTDAAALFDALATPRNSLLLEAADIESKKNIDCLAILTAALRITCRGHDVTATALTPTGRLLLDDLDQRFADRIRSSAPDTTTYRFAPSTAPDERARLRDHSTADILRALQTRAPYRGHRLPLLAGGFAFDYLETFETLPHVDEGPNGFPDYEFLVAELLLHIDHLHRSATLEALGTDERALQQLLDAAAAVTPATPPPCDLPHRTVTARAAITDADFRRHVEDLQDNIRAGDVYQVVPSRAFSLDCPDAMAAYRRLRDTNPSPYMFYLRGADYELFGASPESNLKYTPDTRQIELYPIAGTRPRGLDPDGAINHELDIRNELDMRTDRKEVAEHTMLVDLARNDLARVAAPRTRKVAELLRVDRYSRVMHLVSRVTATLDAGLDALDAYRACMNMGTLTGAPKLRATELIRATEKTRRGSYGGAIGYLRADGAMDTCIVIRSAYVAHGRAIVQAGAGVVRDSQPQAEADETLHKAYAVLAAIAESHNATLEVLR